MIQSPIEAVMRVLADEEMDMEGFYPGYTEDGDVFLLLNCNDLFYWACADCEPIEEGDDEILRGVFRDLNEADWWDGCHVRALFCCRKRKMRPQYPFFRRFDPATQEWEDSLPPAVRALFDACGPADDKNRG